MYPVNRDIILNQLRPLTIDDAPDLNIYDGDETVAKLHHQINAAVKALEDVKDTLTPGLTRQLNKIFKGSMVQAELKTHHEDELADHY
ncbi:uncharacterized protein BDCG_17560 [Blastomyces dermatitidis ER-3]|uniref:Uncharacterized protein n=1 Tax=Ajellomyces dermatitidis (strain ER-3 / ATCC MYA-2586) TaxID=559297 RepID=A0ABX2VZ81_AJEDR|nr:uncharacterized protein BDCG_17560 [Blastomyces dermatitidis ER-3]OAT02445.1 hypothetical protein BDCG_17560 [Blastomyces dermatitidis ER-3]